jgi:hypothetical protein
MTSGPRHLHRLAPHSVSHGTSPVFDEQTVEAMPPDAAVRLRADRAPHSSFLKIPSFYRRDQAGDEVRCSSLQAALRGDR